MRTLTKFLEEEKAIDLDKFANVLHDEIEELNLRVDSSEDVLGKLDDIALMVNKGRLYSASVPSVFANDIWLKLQKVEEILVKINNKL